MSSEKYKWSLQLRLEDCRFQWKFAFYTWQEKVLYDFQMLHMSHNLNLKALKSFQKHFFLSKYIIGINRLQNQFLVKQKNR